MNEEDTDGRLLALARAVGFTARSAWVTPAFLNFLASCGLRVVVHRGFDARRPLCVAICR